MYEDIELDKTPDVLDISPHTVNLIRGNPHGADVVATLFLASAALP